MSDQRTMEETAIEALEMVRYWRRELDRAEGIIKDLRAERDAYQPVAETAAEYIHALGASYLGPYGKQRDMALHNLCDEVAAFDEWEQDL